MFRRKPQQVTDIVLQILRAQGLESPLLQRRIIQSWDEVVGPAISRYTVDKFIKNQTLMVKITNPSLRADLNMRRTMLKDKLNAAVGSMVITDLKFF